MAPKASKKAVVVKRPAAAVTKKPAAAQKSAPTPRTRGKSSTAEVPDTLQRLKAFVVNLERRPDRWARVSAMLRKEVPWLNFEQFKASDGTKNPIPEDDVAPVWNTSCNAHYADYFEWVYDEPGSARDGKQWKWAADSGNDEAWNLVEDQEDCWSYVDHANDRTERKGTVTNATTQETFRVRLQFSHSHLDPGVMMNMSGGERGCAHSHLRLWRVAADRSEPTLVLEDDVQLVFQRTDSSLGMFSGKLFTDRLALALQHVPADFDVLYLGWSGWREGKLRRWVEKLDEDQSRKPFVRRAEYVWTTVAYVITQAGAKKLLSAAPPINQPVDNFMAWEASQGRLNSYVALDAGDTDDTWAGGIMDQYDFQGDSDIKKSDGGHQGDDEKEFAL